MLQIINDILDRFGTVEPSPPDYFESLETYRVKTVSDADTLSVLNAEGEKINIRFVYIDAPETPKGRSYKKVEVRNQENPLYQTQFHWGKQGTDRLKEWVEQSEGKVKLRLIDRDRYGRYIAEVYLLNGDFVQYRLIREGLAKIYYDYFSKCPRDTAIILMLAEAAADRENLGLWQESRANFISPWLFRLLKKKQKKLYPDLTEHDTFTEKIRQLCQDFASDRVTLADFEQQFKDLVD
ncbi:MAG: thermonuclease family protein [Spirulina sp.]